MNQLTGYVMSDSEPAGGVFQLAADSQGRPMRARLVGINGPKDNFGTGEWSSRRALEGCVPVDIPGQVQVTFAGSFGQVTNVPSPMGETGLSCVLWFWPGRHQVEEITTLLSMATPDGATGCRIVTTQSGNIAFESWDEGHRTAVVTEALVVGRAWNGLGLSIVRSTGAISLVSAVKTGVGGVQVAAPQTDTIVLSARLMELVNLGLGATLRADTERGADDVFEGKIDQPRVWNVPLDVSQLGEALHDRPVDAAPIVHWVFGPAAGENWDLDKVSNPLDPRFDLLLNNRPQTAVSGHLWSGSATDFRVTPAEYSAIRFHGDDLADAGWEVTAEMAIPVDLKSGLYGIELSCEGEDDVVPVYVRPSSHAPTADVLYLAPTMTYQAYGNDRQHGHADFGDMTAQRDNGPYEDWIDSHPEFGSSLYDPHPDGSGHSYSTRRRPLGNVRADYVSWITGFPRHYSADLAIVSWLQHTGSDFDVTTDHDLHREGAAALSSYSVVVTGSHPEYYSGEMLDALGEYLRKGGRLMYLGGNGFYWATGVAEDGSIEVRRGHAGTRSSESLPGEDTLMTTREPGGLWRHRGRTPNALVGVGFAAQGWTGGVPYVVADNVPDGLRQRLLGDLAPGAVIGGFGSLGGAAGDEVDRCDFDLGSPANAIVIASSASFGDGYQPAVEDHPTLTPGVGGASNSDVRADITYVPLPGGGGVFSVGSINWFSCLPVNGFDNDIARLSTNVLRSFVAGEL